MISKLKNTKLSKSEKNKLRLKIYIAVILFFIFKVIISDWEDFKAGITGVF